MGAGEAFQRHVVSVMGEGLTLARGARVLAEALSFEAKPGAFIEVRGPNGSGKTTLLRAIAGFLRPRAGRIVIEGAEEPAEALHYVGHQNALKSSISARAHVSYWTGLLGGADDADAALERVGLKRAADLPARVLSQGQQRRLALTRLLVAPRALWILDEPSAALDAEGRALLSDLIQNHCASGGIAVAAVHGALGPPSQTIEMGA